jgi:hypothetical protein
MSTWAAFAVKGAAAAATTAAGAGTAQAITPAALDGFAAGTLLTGMCFLVAVAPRTVRKSGLSARPRLWAAALRHSKVRPDFHAAPAETHSTAVAPDLNEAVLDTPAGPVLETPVLIGPALDAYFQAAQASAAEAPMPEAALTDMPQPQLPLAFADPALEVFSPNASQDYAGHAGADPYAPGVLDPVGYAPTTPPATDPASSPASNSSASNPAFDPGSDDDIVLPGDDDAAQLSRRGYRSKHRLTGQDVTDRRSDPKRKQPRHAAPPSRFGSRGSGRLAVFPLAPARG